MADSALRTQHSELSTMPGTVLIVDADEFALSAAVVMVERDSATTAKGYGLYFEPLNCSKRATVIVDKNGKVAYAKVQEIKVAREDKDILAALAKLS